MWLFFAIGSALFASLTTIFAKIGIDNVPSNLATAIRTIIVLVMSWIMVFITHQETSISSVSNKSWIFLILSGLSTGISWLCYYKAIQMGKVSSVVAIDKMSIIITLILAFIFLGEKFTLKSLFGCIFITAGTLFLVW